MFQKILKNHLKMEKENDKKISINKRALIIIFTVMNTRNATYYIEVRAPWHACSILSGKIFYFGNNIIVLKYPFAAFDSIFYKKAIYFYVYKSNIVNGFSSFI